MANVTPEFEKLNTIYSAIRDIDRIRNSQSEEKFDDILNVIKDIKKQEFDEENTEKIILGIRDALEKIYRESLIKLNSGISLSTTFGNINSFPPFSSSRGTITNLNIITEENTTEDVLYNNAGSDNKETDLPMPNYTNIGNGFIKEK